MQSEWPRKECFIKVLKSFKEFRTFDTGNEIVMKNEELLVANEDKYYRASTNEG